MITHNQQQFNPKDFETFNEKKQLASILIEDVSFNILMNKKRAEMSEKEYPKWVDQMKKLDQQKSVLIKEIEQYQNFLNKVDIKQIQTYEQLGFFGSLRQQEQLQKIQAQIKEKTQMEQQQIDKEILNQVPIKDRRNDNIIENNLQISEEILEIQEEKVNIVNQEIKQNEKVDEFDEVEMENNLDKLKYQSKKASQGRVVKSVINIYRQQKQQQQ